MLAPATLAVINTSFTEEHARARAFGAWSAAGGVGGMAGALVGGALTTGLSWRWVFLINVPIGAVLIGVATMALAGTRTSRRESLDPIGAVTATAGLAALIYGVMQSADHGWASGRVLGPVGAGLLLLVVFTVLQGRFVTQPMVPLRLFKIRGVAVGNVMLLLLGAIAISMWYFTSLFLQNVLGYSALRAGLGQTPAAVTFLLVAQSAAALLPRSGVRPLVLAGSGCFLAGFGWLAQAHADSGYLTSVLGPTLLIAVGIGLTFPTLMAAATADVPDRDAGIIGGLANTASQVGGAVGLAVLATAASARAATQGGGGSSPGALAAGYDLVFLIAAGLGLAIAVVSLLLPQARAAARRTAARRGRRQPEGGGQNNGKNGLGDGQRVFQPGRGGAHVEPSVDEQQGAGGNCGEGGTRAAAGEKEAGQAGCGFGGVQSGPGPGPVPHAGRGR